jgi:hypothetical protein
MFKIVSIKHEGEFATVVFGDGSTARASGEFMEFIQQEYDRQSAQDAEVHPQALTFTA